DRLDFDEVHALRFKGVHGGNGAGGSGYRDGTRETEFPIGQISVQHGPGDDHARADDFSLGDFPAPFQKNGNISAHVADASHAVGDEQWQDDLTSAGKPITKSAMHMHVPKAGNEKLSRGVDDAGAFLPLRSD